MLPRRTAVSISRISSIQSISLRDGSDDWSSSLASTMRPWRDEVLNIFPRKSRQRGKGSPKTWATMLRGTRGGSVALQ